MIPSLPLSLPPPPFSYFSLYTMHASGGWFFLLYPCSHLASGFFFYIHARIWRLVFSFISMLASGGWFSLSMRASGGWFFLYPCTHLAAGFIYPCTHLAVGSLYPCAHLAAGSSTSLFVYPSPSSISISPVVIIHAQAIRVPLHIHITCCHYSCTGYSCTPSHPPYYLLSLFMHRLFVYSSSRYSRITPSLFVSPIFRLSVVIIRAQAIHVFLPILYIHITCCHYPYTGLFSATLFFYSDIQ